MSRLKVAIMPMLLTENRALYQATYQRFMVPLGPVALATYLENLNLPIDILVHDNLEVILNFKPDIVGISSVSENFGYAQECARTFKNKLNSFVVIGGPHITALPEFLPNCFDIGVIGEGEMVFENIIKTALEKGLHKKFYNNLAGISIFEEKEVKINPRPPQIQNLDTLPIPQRKKWVKHIGVPHVMTTRGCVYNCFFCAEPTLFKSFRQHSPLRIVTEIETLLAEYPFAKHIRFYDDIFPVNKKRLRELCQLFLERKLPQSLSFSCFIHAKLVDEEVVDLLRKMNFIFVQFGAETGSPHLIQSIKPSSAIELNQQAINLFYEKGIHIGTTFIVGTPTESLEDLKKTYHFIEKNKKKLVDVEISPAVALPGTELWNLAKKRNLIPDLTHMNWQVFRDSAHLVEFDLNKYIYLASEISPSSFMGMIEKFRKLIDELHDSQKTESFLKQNYMAGYVPVEFMPMSNQ